MVVKSERGRRRYVVYTVPGGTRWDEVLEVLSTDPAPPQLKVISCSSGRAVIRTEPDGLGTVGSRMRTAWPETESIITSGTLRTIRDRYPELKVRRRRKG